MQSKRKKDAVFVIGLVMGIAAGMILHHHGLGVAFGVILGLAFREMYERKTTRF